MWLGRETLLRFIVPCLYPHLPLSVFIHEIMRIQEGWWEFYGSSIAVIVHSLDRSVDRSLNHSAHPTMIRGFGLEMF